MHLNVKIVLAIISQELIKICGIEEHEIQDQTGFGCELVI